MKKMVFIFFVIYVYTLSGSDTSNNNTIHPTTFQAYHISQLEQTFHQLHIPTTTPIKPVVLPHDYQFTNEFALSAESCLPNKQIWIKDSLLINFYLYNVTTNTQSSVSDGVGTYFKGFSLLCSNDTVKRVVVDGPNEQGFFIYGLCIEKVNATKVVNLLFLPQRTVNCPALSEFGTGQWGNTILNYDQEA
jgi:hypothetical protein